MSLQYGFRPTGLIQQCDGCGDNFTVSHTLSCKVGGLVGWRHNNVQDEWAWLCRKALPDSHVSSEPLIDNGARMGAGSGPGGRAMAASLTVEEGSERWGDVSAQSFWTPRQKAIFDVRITDTDAPSYGIRAAAKILAAAEKEKEGKIWRGMPGEPAGFHPAGVLGRWDARS